MILSEKQFSNDSHRTKAGFSPETDSEEYFEVHADVYFEDKQLKYTKLQLFSLNKTITGLIKEAVDISDTLNADIIKKITVNIMENEL